jgi:hypothetical protein
MMRQVLMSAIWLLGFGFPAAAQSEPDSTFTTSNLPPRPVAKAPT